ncbi:MAG: hypothetical protein ABIU09_02510 [Pyrinomonadaceae bacterium]
MVFDPKKLPATVYEAFKLGPGVWPVMVEHAIQANITDVDQIASIVFYLHHPERMGSPLRSDETNLIEEYKAFRKTVKPRVEAAIKHGVGSKNRRPGSMIFKALSKPEA